MNRLMHFSHLFQSQCVASLVTLGGVTSSIFNRSSPNQSRLPTCSPIEKGFTSPSRSASVSLSHVDLGMISPRTQSPLLDAIEDGTFWTLPEVALLRIIGEEFPNELELLKHAYSIRPSGWQEVPNSPSKILYPDEQVYDEVNRSLVGVLALRWINDDDYERFTRGQHPSIRLRQESFCWIRQIFASQGIINSRNYRLYALITSMVSNDLGKSAKFIQMYLESTGLDIGQENHDMVLRRAVEEGMVPAIERLQPVFRDQIKRGIKLGSEFNVGQLAQAEDAPASLAPILDLLGHDNAWNMRWMEQILDIAGAAGHEDHTCALKLIEPIFRSYRSVYDIVCGIVRGTLQLREGYDQNLVTRYHLIISSGWKPHRHLSVNSPQDRAILRIFCMGNVANPKTADLYYTTFFSDLVGDSTRQQLIEQLNRDGSVEQPAIQPTYGPGMMNLAIANLDKAHKRNASANATTTDIETAKQKTVAAMLRYIARVLSKPPCAEILSQGDVTVIERDCRVAIKHIVESEDFLTNPDVLDAAPLAEDVVANRSTEAVR